MSETTDPVRLALTGQLPLILLVSAALAYPVSRGLLWFYTRAVLRSMRVRTTPLVPDAGCAREHRQAPDAAASGLQPPLAIDVIDSAPLPASAAGEALYRESVIRPWRLAAVYAAAGAAYATVMTVGFLRSSGIELLPVRFTIIAWTQLWPAVLAVASVAATTRTARAWLVAAYLGVLGPIGSLALTASPDMDVRQIVVFWILTNGPPSVLLLAFLARRVRAVGPLVLTFIVAALLGSNILLFGASATDAGLRRVVGLGMAIRLHARGIFVALALTGFLVFGTAGWLALRVLGRWYEQRRIGDQSLTLAAMWLLFAVVGSVDFVFQGAWWGLTGVVAFGAYVAATGIGFRLIRRYGTQDQAPHLLWLRVFSLGRQSERLYDVLATAWRHVGTISLIAGPDLATTTIEPHEFLAFVGGTLSRRFIDGPAALEQRLSEADRGRDPDGRFRVADFFCHDDTWKLVLERLVSTSEAVLIDLRRFTRAQAGCIFEIQALVAAMPLERVVFVIDGTTDRPFLEGVVQDAWRQRRLSQGLALTKGGRLRLLMLSDSRGAGARRLQRVLCTAARPMPAPVSASG
jgi:hypothetical protein